MSKEIEFDNLDDDLGLDMDLSSLDSDGSFANIDKSGKRNPVGSSLKNVGKSIIDNTVSDPLETATDIAKRAIPSSMSAEFSNASDLYSSTKEEILNAAKEIRNTGASLTKAVDSILPDNSYLKSLTSKLLDKLSVDEEQTPSGPSKEQLQQEEITRSILESVGDKANYNDLLKSQIESNRNRTLQDIGIRQLSNLEQINKFNQEITNGYFRRSLELQYKQLFTSKEQLEVMKTGVDTFKTQLEAVVKNTALPDIVKYNTIEGFKEDILSRGRNTTLDLIHKSFDPIGNIQKRIKDKISEATTSYIDAMGAATMGAEHYKELTDPELGLTKESMAGMLITEWLKDKAGSVLGKQFEGSLDGKNFIHGFKTMMMDPEKFFKDASGKKFVYENFGDKASELMLSVSQMFKGTNSSSDDLLKFERKNQNDASIFDNRAHTSIVKIIPGLLSKIYGELKTLRLDSRECCDSSNGSSKRNFSNPEDHELYFDNKDNLFRTKKDYTNVINTRFEKQVNKHTNKYSNDFLDLMARYGFTFTNAEEKEISSAYVKHLLKSKNASPFKLLENPSGNSFVSLLRGGLKTKVTTALTRILYLSKRRPEILDNLYNTNKGVIENTRSMNTVAADLFKDGHTGIIQNLGITKNNEEHGGLYVDRDKTYNKITNIVGSSFDKDRHFSRQKYWPKLDANTIYAGHNDTSVASKNIDTTTNSIKTRRHQKYLPTIIPNALGSLTPDAGLNMFNIKNYDRDSAEKLINKLNFIKNTPAYLGTINTPSDIKLFKMAILNLELPLDIINKMAAFDGILIGRLGNTPYIQNELVPGAAYLPKIQDVDGSITHSNVLLININTLEQYLKYKSPAQIINLIAHEYTHLIQAKKGIFSAPEHKSEMDLYTKPFIFKNRQYSIEHIFQFGKYLQAPWEKEAYKSGVRAEFDKLLTDGVIPPNTNFADYYKHSMNEIKKAHSESLKYNLPILKKATEDQGGLWLFDNKGLLDNQLLKQSGIDGVINGAAVKNNITINTPLGGIASNKKDIRFNYKKFKDKLTSSKPYSYIKKAKEINYSTLIPDTSDLITNTNLYKSVSQSETISSVVNKIQTGKKLTQEEYGLFKNSDYKDYYKIKKEQGLNVANEYLDKIKNSEPFQDLASTELYKSITDKINNGIKISKDERELLKTTGYREYLKLKKEQGKAKYQNLKKDIEESETLNYITNHTHYKTISEKIKAGYKLATDEYNIYRESDAGSRKFKIAIDKLLNNKSLTQEEFLLFKDTELAHYNKLIMNNSIDEAKEYLIGLVDGKSYAKAKKEQFREFAKAQTDKLKDTTLGKVSIDLFGDLKKNKYFEIGKSLFDDISGTFGISKLTKIKKESFSIETEIADMKKDILNRKLRAISNSKSDFLHEAGVFHNWSDKIMEITEEDDKKFRTAFYLSDEYLSGAITNYHEWLTGHGFISPNRDTLSAYYSKLNPADYKEKIEKTLTEKYENFKDRFKLKRIKDEDADTYRYIYYNSPEYKAGVAPDFEEWLKDRGLRIGAIIRLPGIKDLLRKTRELDKIIFGKTFGAAWNATKFLSKNGLKLGFGAAKTGLKYGIGTTAYAADAALSPFGMGFMGINDGTVARNAKGLKGYIHGGLKRFGKKIDRAMHGGPLLHRKDMDPRVQEILAEIDEEELQNEINIKKKNSIFNKILNNTRKMDDKIKSGVESGLTKSGRGMVNGAGLLARLFGSTAKVVGKASSYAADALLSPFGMGFMGINDSDNVSKIKTAGKYANGGKNRIIRGLSNFFNFNKADMITDEDKKDSKKTITKDSAIDKLASGKNLTQEELNLFDKAEVVKFFTIKKEQGLEAAKKYILTLKSVKSSMFGFGTIGSMNGGPRAGDWRERLDKVNKKTVKEDKKPIEDKKENSITKYLGMLVPAVLGILSGIKKLFSPLTAISKLIETLSFSSLGTKALGVMGGVGATIGSVAKGAKDKIVTLGSKLIEVTAAFKNKVKAALTGLREPIIKKLGEAGAKPILGKLASKLTSLAIPGLGIGLLAYTATMIAKDMNENGTNFNSAVSKEVLGFDVFDSNSVASDNSGNPVKPGDDNIEDENKKQSITSKVSNWVSDKYTYVKDLASTGFNKAKDIGSKIYSKLTSGIGAVSAMFESGKSGAGTISSGKGDAGGVSYGTHQLSSKTGTLNKYLAFSKYGNEFANLTPGTEQFNNKWREIYNRDPEGFKADQERFITETHYVPQVNKLSNNGLDVNNRSLAVQNAVYSVGVQFGPSSNLIPNAMAANNIDPKNVEDRDLITSIYKYKQDNNDSLFKSSSPSVRSSTYNRAVNEEKVVLNMLGSEVPGIKREQNSITPINNTEYTKPQSNLTLDTNKQNIDNLTTDNNVLTTEQQNKNLSVNKPQITPDTLTAMQPMVDNAKFSSDSNKVLNTISDTLTKSLEVQIKMANAIENLTRISVKDRILDKQEIEEKNNNINKQVNNSISFPEPVVDLKRRINF